MPGWLTDPFFVIGGVLFGVLFLVVRRRHGDGALALAVGLVAMGFLWTGVSWASAIGTEAVLATLAIAVGFGVFEWAKRLGDR